MVEQDQHAIYLLESLRKIYEEDESFLSDITISVGGEEIKAHKLVLAAQSDFFKGLFRNEVRNEVKIDICSHATLQTIVKYFYTGSSEINTDNVQDILVASNFLQVKELIYKCSDFMARNLDMINCVTVLRLADLLNNDSLLQESINFIGDHFQQLFKNNAELRQLPVDMFAKCIKSDRIILFSTHGTVLPAIQREEALVRIIVEYVRSHDQEKRIKDTWPLFRALKLPFIAHHLDFRELGLPELANFDDDPTVHSLIRSSRVQKEDDLRRKYSVDPFSKHNSKLRAYSIKYVIWSERFGCGPNSSYRETRPFACEGGMDKFISRIQLFFRPWEAKHILGGLKVSWSNGSTDVAGETETSEDSDLQSYSVDLSENENIQKVDLRAGWFIDRIQMVSNTGKIYGPFGGEGGESKKTQRLLRRNVDPRYVYLDGIKGYVVKTEGRSALNRLSFKWSFFLDRKISKYSYYNSVVIKEDNEKICVAELESEINLTISDDKGKKRYFPSPSSLSHSADAMSEDEDYQILGMDFDAEEPGHNFFEIPMLQPDPQPNELPFLY